ncbi:MAG TPA: D-threitol dehydrogenase [Anaeromyxobacteraceae bacterium]|nr:D-threitol dehydrogenase [Anaeromyxobacteraceae bacterium]
MAYEFDGAFDLTGKTALVTGSAAGIGLAIAKLFAQRGANLVLVDVSPAVTDLAASLPGGVQRNLPIAADVTDGAAVDAIVASAVKRFGAIDILVNCAGIVRLDKAEVATEDDWDRTMAVNLKAPFLLSQRVGRTMIARRSGRIVNIASQASIIALDRHVAYCTSKAALVGMTKVLAAEWAQHGIAVNAVSPTVVETELGKKAWAGEVGEAMKKKIPVGRFGQPEEIAAAVLYLVSGVAGMITGENLIIDGGYTIQ